MSQNASHRVVITSAGLVTANGLNAPDTWKATLAGKSGVSTITGLDTEAFPTHIAAEIKGYEAAEYLDLKDTKRTDRMVHFAAHAAGECLHGVDLDGMNRDRVGVIIGSGIGGIATFETQHERFLERGPGKVSPFFIPMMISDMASGYISIVHGLKGPKLRNRVGVFLGWQCDRRCFPSHPGGNGRRHRYRRR